MVTMTSSTLFICILAAASPVISQPGLPILNQATDGCTALASAGLDSLLLLPSDPEYAERQASYWAPNVALGPTCIVQPRSAANLSDVIKSLSSSKSNFAIRSGGHIQWAGGNDIQDGVTIDLYLLNDITYNAETNVASFGPGPRWRDVYSALADHGVIVTGGRDADVGVGGFLTGGGNSFLTAQNGFGCDTVVNFEVVLADGSIVNANKSSNPDLWKALKGGWANFGIVSRFDLEAYPAKTAWGGLNVHERSAGNQITTALINFNDNMRQFKEDALVILATYGTFVPLTTVIGTVVVDTEGVENGPGVQEIQEIPVLMRDQAHRSIPEIAERYTDPSNNSVHWFSLNFNNDKVIADKSLELHDVFIEELTTLLGPGMFTTQSILQPIPSLFGEIGSEKGGNVLGLDRVKTNSILWLGTVKYMDPSQSEAVHSLLKTFSDNLEAFADSRDGHVPWRYINYVDKTQDPLASYGPDNVDFMKNVAAKYDPQAIFQTQVPGSFKISAI